MLLSQVNFTNGSLRKRSRTIEHTEVTTLTSTPYNLQPNNHFVEHLYTTTHTRPKLNRRELAPVGGGVTELEEGGDVVVERVPDEGVHDIEQQHRQLPRLGGRLRRGGGGGRRHGGLGRPQRRGGLGEVREVGRAREQGDHGCSQTGLEEGRFRRKSIRRRVPALQGDQ